MISGKQAQLQYRLAAMIQWSEEDSKCMAPRPACLPVALASIPAILWRACRACRVGWERN